MNLYEFLDHVREEHLEGREENELTKEDFYAGLRTAGELLGVIQPEPKPTLFQKLNRALRAKKRG